MSWLDTRSKRQFNRTAYLVHAGGEKEKFNFSYVVEVPTSINEDDTISRLEVQKETKIIETPTTLFFDKNSMIEIDGILHDTQAIDSLPDKSVNGRFIKSSVVIKRLTISRRI